MVSSPTVSLSTHMLTVISVPLAELERVTFWGMAAVKPSSAISNVLLWYVLKKQNFRVDTETRFSDGSFRVVARGERRQELEDSS